MDIICQAQQGNKLKNSSAIVLPAMSAVKQLQTTLSEKPDSMKGGQMGTRICAV